ncbi:MAG: hypothetical protein FWG25_02880 [Promicromonosporaceae bacterium]|nr:hypothetical protein [Promicromonosporaceae bacterium]
MLRERKYLRAAVSGVARHPERASIVTGGTEAVARLSSRLEQLDREES